MKRTILGLALVAGLAFLCLAVAPTADAGAFVIANALAVGASGKTVEQLLAEVNLAVDKIGDDVKRTAESALKQAKEAGVLSAETKESADKLLRQQNDILDAQRKLTQKLEDLDGRSSDIEKKLANRRGPGAMPVRSLGETVTEHDDIKTFVARGAAGSVKIKVNAAITSITGSAGALIWSDREQEIVRLPRRQMTVRQLLSQGRTSSNLIEYVKQTVRTNNAAVVSETRQKPESNYVWERTDTPVRTIAHFIHVARQTMDDIPMLQSEIDGELRYGLDLEEEDELLNGSGTGEHLSGLIPNATAFSAAFTPSDEQMIDRLRLAMLQASLAEFPADGFVINPEDWARIELLKDGENRYLWSNPRGSSGPSLWGKPGVETQAISSDKFLVGAFRTAATIYDRMDVEVLISSEDRDNFIKNMLTVRAEKRLALAIKRALALVYGDFGNE